MFNQIHNYFHSNKLYYGSQYGFRKKHSTELAAIEVIDRVIQKMDNNEIPINVYLDLSKAFDTLDHNILLYKLEYYGINGTFLNLLKSYLYNRKQYVEFDGIKSNLADITTGVPQGSILGPLLFIIYTNDISKACDIFKSIIYADDTTLMSTLNTFDTLNAHSISDNINKELAKIDEWLKLNKLSLNIQKSKFMLFYMPQKNVVFPSLKINNIPLECIDCFNFLGITIDKHLTWKDHINKIANKVSKTAGVINKLKHYIPQTVLMLT